ncbi:MAG: peptidylprolyl isomerase [OCS116 cluster bacterium]|nr:peptidylprolyl isomerase [OCS116 cluster bacterium]
MGLRLLKPLYFKNRWSFMAAALLCVGMAFGTAKAADELVIPLDPSEKLVAIVNGISIRQYEYDIAKQSLQEELTNLSKAQQQQRILQFLIDLKLMSEAARQDGFDEMIEYQQKIAFLSEQTLNNLYFVKKVLEKIDDKALQAFYDQEMKKIVPSSETRARHILFDDEDSGKKILSLLNDGADFAEMAEQHSTGPTKTQGGDLGYFSDGEMVTEFSAAIAGLKIGEYTKSLVKTKFGYHIIMLVDVREKPLPTFEKIKNSLYGILVQNKVDELSSELRKSAQIELFIEQEALDVQKTSANSAENKTAVVPVSDSTASN